MSKFASFDIGPALAVGGKILAGARQLRQTLQGAPAGAPGNIHTNGTETRFVPPPLTISDDQTESDSTWGFADTRFEARADSSVVLTGSRYSLCGEPLPNLLPWIRDVMEADMPPDDVNPAQFPPVLPDPVLSDEFLEEIKTFLSNEAWSVDGRHRLRRGHGHTQEEMWAINHGKIGRIPDLVVWPSDQGQVERLVQAAAKHNVVLIPYGGGTNVTDALRCPDHENRCIVSMDMGKMNRILWIDPVNRMACIEAGAVGRHLMTQLAEHGFTLGHEPDSVEFSTMGGWIATHASGMKKNKYGNIEDVVLDMTVVTAAGTLTRSQAAPRESVGIDPRLWLFGSEGKLGIITSAVVKLFPLPEVQRYGSVIFPDFERGVAFMYELTQTGRWPASARLVDNMQFQFSQALKPANKGWKVHKSKIEKAFVTQLQGFDPGKMTACTLVFEGDKREVQQQEELLYGIAKKHGGLPAGGENGARGYQLTFGIAYIRDFVMDHWVIAESFETSVPWSQCIALCENVKKRLYTEHAARGLPGKPFVTCRVTQIYDTGCCVYFYFAFYYKGVAHPSEVYSEIELAARQEVLAQGGSLSHHHGIGKIRQRFLPEIASPALLKWQAQLKQAVDPTNIFGCGNQATADDVLPANSNSSETSVASAPARVAPSRSRSKPSSAASGGGLV